MIRSIAPLLMPLALAVASEVDAQERIVFRLPVTAPVGIELGDLVTATLQSAGEVPGSVVILEMSAAGGRLDIAQLIVGDLQSTSVPVYALIDDRAWGAVALLALASDSIFIAGEGTIGAGTESDDPGDQPTPAALGILRRVYGSLAAQRGADPRIGEAMVDQSVRVSGLGARNQRLTLDADAAVEAGLAAGRVVDLDDLLSVLRVLEPEIRVVADLAPRGTTVQVENFNVSNIRVVLLRGGARYRLGTIPTNSSSTFEIELTRLPDGARITLLAEVIGGSGQVETEEILVRPGLVIQWRVETQLSQSNLFHYIR